MTSKKKTVPVSSTAPAAATTPFSSSQHKQHKSNSNGNNKPTSDSRSSSFCPLLSPPSLSTCVAAAAVSSNSSSPATKNEITEQQQQQQQQQQLSPSPSPVHIDEQTFSLRLLSPSSGVSIADLVAALVVRLICKKRVWMFVVLAIAVSVSYHKQEEIREAGMKFYPQGLQIEENDRPGVTFNTSRIKVQRPVVIVPGFITTGLDLWSGRKCILSDVSTNFRQRMFGPSMMLKLFQDPECYMEHLSLDPETGGDPHPKIKIRHSTGFDSVDYIDRSGIYWVWAKLMRNLADIGYEPKNMHVASYDWRMDPELAEERYGYFSRLKSKIETVHEFSSMTTSRSSEVGDESSAHPASPRGIHAQPKQRVVIVAHSYGVIMAREFLNWADQKQPGWTDKFVHSVVGFGGPHVGIPKANAALTSGEVKDTAALPSITRRLVDSHVLRRSRANAFRTWGCLGTMMTRGPEQLFPNVIEFTSTSTTTEEEGAEDQKSITTTTLQAAEAQDKQQHEREQEEHARKRKIQQQSAAANNRNKDKPKTPLDGKTLGTAESAQLIRRIAKASGNTRLADFIDNTSSIRNVVPQFPSAKSTKLYCVYGTGLGTEIGYYYKQPQRRRKRAKRQHDPLIAEYDLESIEFDFDTPTSAVRLGDGDGTVPLMSLGYPCRSTKNGYARNLEKVVTVELKHEPAPMDPRGGIYSGDHVDGMGNWNFIDVVLKIVSGMEDEVQDVIITNIDERAREIDDAL